MYTMTTTGGERTAELWVRSFAPTECTARREAVLAGLEALVEAGDLDAVTVRVWGDEVVVDGDLPDPAREILDRVERFESWAATEGCSLAPAFERRVVECTFTDDRCVSQRLPAMALAEYRDGDVHCVTPYAVDGTTVSVAERVDRIAERSRDGRSDEEHADPLLAD